MTFTFDIFFVLVNVTVRSYIWPTKKKRVNELGDQVIVGDDENDREAERIVHRQTLVIKKKRTLWLLTRLTPSLDAVFLKKDIPLHGMFYLQPTTRTRRCLTVSSLIITIGFAIGCVGLAWVILFILGVFFLPNSLGIAIYNMSLNPFVKPWLFVIFFLVPTVLTAAAVVLDMALNAAQQRFLAVVNFALALFFLFAFINFFVSAFPSPVVS